MFAFLRQVRVWDRVRVSIRALVRVDARVTCEIMILNHSPKFYHVTLVFTTLWPHGKVVLRPLP